MNRRSATGATSRPVRNVLIAPLLLPMTLLGASALTAQEQRVFQGRLVDLGCFSSRGAAEYGAGDCGGGKLPAHSPKGLRLGDGGIVILTPKNNGVEFGWLDGHKVELEVAGTFWQRRPVALLVADSIEVLSIEPLGPARTDDSGEPLMVEGDVKAPVRTFSPEPEYTPEARQARIQGVVIVRALIDVEGRVKEVKVLKGMPMGLEQKAVEAIRKWRFEPATLHGKPVPVYYNLTSSFRIQ